MSNGASGFAYLSKLWWEQPASRRFILYLSALTVGLPCLELAYRYGADVAPAAYVPALGALPNFASFQDALTPAPLIPGWMKQFFLYPALAPTWPSELLELGLAWFFCANAERYGEQRRLWLKLLLGVPVLSLVVALLSLALRFFPGLLGPGLVGLIALGILAAEKPQLTFSVAEKQLTLQKGQLIAVLGYALLALALGGFANACAALLTIPLGLMLAGRARELAVLFAKASGAKPSDRSETPPAVGLPGDMQPVAHSMHRPRLTVEAPSKSPSAAQQLWQVAILDFDQLLVGSPKELLTEHFSIAEDEAIALIMSMPCVVVSGVSLNEARLLGEKLTGLGAAVEIQSFVENGSSASAPAAAETDAGRLPCYWCAQLVAPAARLCSHCGKSLLLDAFLGPLSQEPRTRYAQLKQLSQAVFGGSFSQAQRVADNASPVKSQLTQLEANELNRSCESIGLRVELRPSSSRSIAGRWLFELRWPAAIAIVMVVTATVFYLRRDKPTAAMAAPIAAEIGQDANDKVASLSCDRQAGTGFFVEPTLLLTNAHVLCGNAGEIKVTLRTGQVIDGKVEKRDHAVDLATVRVEQENPTFSLGDATQVKQGSPIYLIGNPNGLGFSLSKGIIAHARRRLEGIWLLQLDATVNPGNSGGPVLDASGNVIGIVTLKALSMEGIAFAVPINYAYVADGSMSLLLSPPSGATDEAFRNAFNASEPIKTSEPIRR